MAKRDYIITAFALSKLKIKAYEGQLGEEFKTKSSGEFTSFDEVPATRMDVGEDDIERTSWFGTPVWADMILKLDDEDEGLLVDTLLLEITQTKNIVTTAVSGRNGTVKEYVSDGDYVINAKGLFATQSPDTYPIEEVNEFLKKMKYADALQIVSPFAQLFSIHNIVITDYRLPQQEGFQNVQLFEFNALSETNIVLIEDV